MNRTQIFLTAAQTKALDSRACAEGRTRSDLIREAVDAFLAAPRPKTGAAMLALMSKSSGAKLEGFEARQKAWRGDLSKRLVRLEASAPRLRRKP
ncbi:MAG: ribbon-helix-helix protein, CopG family [Alphaproteobacteria bacterium]|nr:ribbon-helix-helix protein, CopG family [Alphaproteobacteria bacterium]